jgi:bacterioferritin (cytochrome b1)
MNKIIANKSILENKATKCIFIATKLTEETQCMGANREHIEWVGELDISVPDVAEVLRKLFKEIEHGEQEHRDWLKDKIETFIYDNDL